MADIAQGIDVGLDQNGNPVQPLIDSSEVTIFVGEPQTALGSSPMLIGSVLALNIPVQALDPLTGLIVDPGVFTAQIAFVRIGTDDTLTVDKWQAATWARSTILVGGMAYAVYQSRVQAKIGLTIVPVPAPGAVLAAGTLCFGHWAAYISVSTATVTVMQLAGLLTVAIPEGLGKVAVGPAPPYTDPGTSPPSPTLLALLSAQSAAISALSAQVTALAARPSILDEGTLP